jgi:hypothetical protein
LNVKKRIHSLKLITEQKCHKKCLFFSRETHYLCHEFEKKREMFLIRLSFSESFLPSCRYYRYNGRTVVKTTFDLHRAYCLWLFKILFETKSNAVEKYTLEFLFFGIYLKEIELLLMKFQVNISVLLLRHW